MSERKVYKSLDGAVTLFDVDSELAKLQDLCGSITKKLGQEPRTEGLFAVASASGDIEQDQWSLVQQSFTDTQIELAWQDKQALRLESRWQFCADTGLWRRSDKICNSSDQPITLTRVLARFTFAPADYELYSQASRWCSENQGHWQDLTHGVVTLRSEGGRTTQGGTPYACLRSKQTNTGIIFHVIPRGDWVIKVSSPNAGFHVAPCVVVELGLSDEELRLELAAGESLQMPDILMQPLTPDGIETAAAKLHRYLLKQDFATAKDEAPLVYNTWFDAFENLDVDRLRTQLAAAKEIGCEVFTVDAGWYGQMEGNWGLQVGDWREKLIAAFKGQMKQFADEVRSAGLGFGLWMEPERNCAGVPAVKEHPEYFIRGAGGQYYPDLCNPDAYQYVLGEMSRLTEEYQLAWMKVDFNFELEHDKYKRSFADYYQEWYRLLDELRAKHPNTFYEGCASGGLRLDINTLKHNDGHFLSDTVYPCDTLRIYQGAVLRSVPGRFTTWAVLRGIDDDHALPYGSKPGNAPQTYITAKDATWETSQTVDIDFAARVNLLSMFGLGGDMASLPSIARQRLKQHGEFYKQWRKFIAGSISHLLTPVKLREDTQGWVAVQLQNPQQPNKALLYVYRLEDGNDTQWIPLRYLQPESNYRITNTDAPEAEPQLLSTAELMDLGLEVKLAKRNNAAIFVLEQA